MTVPPDVVVPLPPDWQWWRRDITPLALGPATGSGVLHVSSPAGAARWRSVADLAALARETADRAGLGLVLASETGVGDYGPYGRVECIDDESGDVCAWVIVPETHDPLWVTWLAETPTDDGVQARAVVPALRPGACSAAVTAVLPGVRAGLAGAGTVRPVALLLDDAARTVACLEPGPGDGQPAVAQVRDERDRLGAAAVVRVAEAAVGTPEGERRVAVVHAESAARRVCYFLPVAGGGRVVHRVDADAPGVVRSFAPVVFGRERSPAG